MITYEEFVNILIESRKGILYKESYEGGLFCSFVENYDCTEEVKMLYENLIKLIESKKTE